MRTLCVTRVRAMATRSGFAVIAMAYCAIAPAAPRIHGEATLAARPAAASGSTRLRLRGELSQRAPPVIESAPWRISARLTSAALNGACVSDVIFRDGFGS